MNKNFTKLIIVPKDKCSEELLDYDLANDSQLYILKLKEAFFLILWKNNIFSDINKICNVNIDDFEDEKITNANSINLVINYLIKRERVYGYEEDMQCLLKMFELALKEKVGIYFYF